MRVSFSVLLGLGALLIHVWFYVRFVRPALRGRGGRGAVLAVFAAFTFVLGFRGEVRDALPEWAGFSIVQASYVWFGFLLFLLASGLTVEGVRASRMVALRGAGLVAALRPARREAAVAPVRPAAETVAEAVPDDPDRRLFLARATGAGVTLAGASLATYGTWRAFAAPEVSELALSLPRLPRTLDGLRVVQITDLHVGPFIRRRFVEALVERVNALRPDLVVVTGDLVDGDVPTLGDSVSALADLRARFGRFFVTGNHEYYSGEREWTAFLDSIGIPSLRNRREAIGDGGGTFDLVGVDDWSGGKRRGRPGYDLDRALAGRDPERAAVLLAHQPAGFDDAAARGVDVQISGHTHGGQIFPGTALIGLQWPYTRGLYRRGDAHLYVSRGCGFWGPPMRVDSPPELLALTLTT